MPRAGLVPADAQHARPRQGRDGLEEEELLLRQQLRRLRRLLHRRARLQPAGADGEEGGSDIEREGGGRAEGRGEGRTNNTISAFIDCLRERERGESNNNRVRFGRWRRRPRLIV